MGRLPASALHLLEARRFVHAPLIHPCRDRLRPVGTASPRPTRSRRKVQVGVLECRGGASVGFIVGSVTNLGCVLRADRPAGRLLCRDHPQGWPRHRHHPGDPRWPGACSRRSTGSDRVISPATTPAPRAARRSVSASAATCWSAAPTIRSRCSRSACRARSASALLPAWKAWNSVRGVNASLVGCSPRAGCAALHLESRGFSAATFSRLPKPRDRRSIASADPIMGRAPKLKEAANGTRRQKSPRSTVHCTGGPFPKR